MQKDKSIISLIRRTGAIRRFKDAPVEYDKIKKIVTAGIWGPSVLAFQPWEYILVSNKGLIEDIAFACRKNASNFPSAVEKILLITSNVINSSNFLVAIYNNQRLSKHVEKKYGIKWIKYINNAELLSIGASIQNMYLVSSYLGLGSVWLDSPCLLQKKINHLLKTDLELVAFLAIGYSDAKAVRSVRNKRTSKLIFLK